MITVHAFTLIIDLDEDRVDPEAIQYALETMLGDYGHGIKRFEVDYAGQLEEGYQYNDDAEADGQFDDGYSEYDENEERDD